jgi:hypothetical protein
VGGLAFLNTWDIATMAFVVAAAAFVGNFTRVRAITGDLFVQAVSFVLPLLVLAIVMYLPFYTSFTSQADGILRRRVEPRHHEPGRGPSTCSCSGAAVRRGDPVRAGVRCRCARA